MNVPSHIARSADGVPIHYDVQGTGAPALVFVHGWCCNRHYWDWQTDHFAPHHTVVRLDLAGHGTSGRGRARLTMPAFGQDVVAVVEQVGLSQVVLIGHSMGGMVIVETARHLPDVVIGLVGADTWHDVEHARTPPQIAEFLVPFQTDFVEAARSFVRAMFLPTSGAALVKKIVANMSATAPQIGISALEEGLPHQHLLRERLQEIQVPKVTINAADRGETNMDAAQRCGIQVRLMSGVGHFVMIEDPQTFNRLLDEAIQEFIVRSAP